MMEQNNLPKLPRGWVWAKIEDVLQTLESGGRPRGGVRNIKEGVPSIGGEHLLYNGGFDFTNIRYIPREFYEKMAKGKIQKKDILVVKDGATTGKTAFVADSFPFSEAAVNEHVFILRIFEGYMEPKYLFFWMQSPYGQSCVKENFKGTAQGGINSYFVKNSSFALPPLPEQHRIVAKIEELFTKLDAGVEALKKVKAQLKRYRQAVLKHAFEGKLTEEWRKAHRGEIEPASVLLERIKEERKKAKGKYKELPPLDTSNLPELPEGWVWTRVGEVMEPSKEKVDPTKVEEVPYISLEHIEKDTGKLLGHGHSSEVRSSKTKFNSGDLLYGKLRPYLNKVHLANFEGVCSTDILVFPKADIPNAFFLYRFMCRDFVNYASQNVSGVNLPRVSFKTLAQFEIALPPLLEQHKIVEEIERRLSVADEVEKIVEQNLKRAEKLRQSILKKAFEGKLVPQDPSDEPAEKLLERIRAEKARHEAEGKKKRKMRSKKS